MKYHQLSLYEREMIWKLKSEGLSNRKIAKQLRRAHSTISRELNRHSKYLKEYIPCKAHERAKKISQNQRKRSRLKSTQIYLYVRTKLRERLSPEQISGRLPIDHPGNSIHFETIYQYIYSKDGVKEKLYLYLVKHRKRRMNLHGRKVKSEKITNKLPIEQRPKIVSSRSRYGDWETDNVEGLRSDKTSISISTERKSRYVLISKLKDHKSDTKAEALVSDLSPFKTLTITADNGSENARHERISEDLNTKIYFCNPYHSWEKGGTENSNGIFRRYVPKGTSIDDLTQEQIKEIEYIMNSRPRKCLKYKTSNEMINKILRI